jgi:predicted phosphodiesterase
MRISLLLSLLGFLCISSCRFEEVSQKPSITTLFVFSDLHLDEHPSMDSPVYRMLEDALGSSNDTIQTDSIRIQNANAWIFNGDLTGHGKEMEWERYVRLIDSFASLGKVEVFENFGNHDGARGGFVRHGIAQRNRQKMEVTHSENGLFSAKDFGNYRIVTLGLYPGNEWVDTCEWCHYFKDDFKHPEYSLDFLKFDIHHPSNKGKSYVLFFHYGWDTFSQKWWTIPEQESLYEVIKDHQVKAIFTGHNHQVGQRKWKGIDVFSSGSPQKEDQTGNYLIVHLTHQGISVEERQKGKTAGFKFQKSFDSYKIKQNKLSP